MDGNIVDMTPWKMEEKQIILLRVDMASKSERQETGERARAPVISQLITSGW